MDQPLAPPRALRPARSVLLVAALALVSALAAWALLDRQRPTEPAPPAVTAEGPRIVTVDGLTAIAGLRGRPVYWAGPLAGALYEATQTPAGYVYVRYLPSGTAPGDRRARFLTVATYGRTDAYGDIVAASRRPGARSIDLPGGGLAVYDAGRPTNVYLAYPGSTEQIEVFHPSAAEARRLVESGRVRPVP